MLVSICIPTFSRLHYLKEAVQSAKEQTYPSIEICVSQNPQTNGPDKSIQEWCKHEALQENLIYNLNDINLGLSGNLNKLSALANGEYVIFLGDDDLLHPDFVKNLIEKQGMQKADIIFSNQYFINESGKLLENETKKLSKVYKRTELKEGLIENTVACVFNNSIPLSASLIIKNLCFKYPFNEELNTPELPFFLKVALNNGAFFYVDKQLAYYRLHKDTETNNGLTTAEMLADIISIYTPDRFKQLKANFIQRAIVPSVNKALLKGNKKLASSLLNSSYFPKKPFLKIAQALMIILPVQIVRLLFKLRKAKA